MKIYDVSRELLTSPVYPGDKSPRSERIRSIERGDLYNLTELSLNAHNGTHLDAPCHFLADASSAAEIDLSKTVGECYVATVSEPVDDCLAAEILKKAKSVGAAYSKKILLKGREELELSGAEAFSKAGVDLIGCELLSVGPVAAPMDVHVHLLSKGVALLESLDLSGVSDGGYFLCAAPLKIAGSDGAPCRALLISQND